MTTTGPVPDLPARDHALAAAAVAIFCGSAGAAAFKLLTATSSGQAIAERSLIAAVILLVWILVQGRGRFLSIGRNGLMRAVLDALAAFTFALAIFELPLSVLTSIHMSVPIVSMVLAVTLLGEDVTRRHILAVGIGFAGIIIVVQPSVSFAPLGVGLALASTIAYSLRDALNRRLPVTSSGPQMALISVVLSGSVAALLAGGSDWDLPVPIDVLAIILAALCYVCSSTLIIRALRTAPLTVVSALRYSAIFWAILFDFLIDHRVPAATTLLGALLVVVSGFILFRPLSGPPKAYANHPRRTDHGQS